jgi:hypothetical protein
MAANNSVGAVGGVREQLLSASPYLARQVLTTFAQALM